MAKTSLSRVASALKKSADEYYRAADYDHEWFSQADDSFGPSKASVTDAEDILRTHGWTAVEFLEELKLRTSERWVHFHFPSEFIELAADRELFDQLTRS